MKKILLILSLFPILVFSQKSYKIPADSTILNNIGSGKNELVIRNATSNITGGVLTNLGNGVTAFVLGGGSARVVDTIYKNNAKDSIVFMISGIRYAIKDSIGVTDLSGYALQSSLNDTASTLRRIRKVDSSYLFKNATRDSICMVTVINGNTYRTCAFDSSNVNTDSQSLQLFFTDSILLGITRGNSIKFAYAVDSVGLNAGGDSIVVIKAGVRKGYAIGSSGGGYSAFNDSLGTPINDTTRTAFRGGNLVVNGIMMGRGRLNIANNTAFGSQALSLSNTANSYLSAFGSQALARQTTGAYNNAFGYLALNQNIINSYLNAFGTEALYNTKANNNSGFGYRAGFSNITGVSNAYFGNGAGYAGLASYNSFFGDLSGRNYTGSYATGCGQASLFTATSGSQTAIGANALYSTTGADNIGIGFQSGQGLTSGTNNFLGGKQSGFSLGSGANNVMIGHFAGNVATSSSNTFIGSASGQSITNGSKNTYLGRYNGSSHTTRSKLIILSDGDGTIGMLIDSVQRVGIGNVVPTAKLSVQGSATVSTSTPLAPDASAVLEIQSTTQGFRIVPITATQASAITAVEGLMLFVSDTNGTFTSIGLWCYENGAWSKK